MNKPRNLQAAIDRMKQRAQRSQDLPQAQQEDAYYCAGMPLREFAGLITAGDKTATAWSLDVVLAERPLHPGTGACYFYHIRAALRTACAECKLSTEHKRMLEDVEARTLHRLMLRAFHSHPGPSQERAARRIPEQQQLMLALFNDSYSNMYIDYDEWPAVPPPQNLIRKVFRKAKLPAAQAERFIKSSYELLMDVYHAPETLFPEHMKLHELPRPDADKLCYFFCRETKPIAEWVIAPLRNLEELCGFIIAADGSFFYNADEWNSGYGTVLS